MHTKYVPVLALVLESHVNNMRLIGFPYNIFYSTIQMN